MYSRGPDSPPRSIRAMAAGSRAGENSAPRLAGAALMSRSRPPGPPPPGA
ncbi:Uncharacterised protein [Bordetella pertussis]|nr:Uncharacterised protein [Bordetella pertussis]